MSCEKYQILIEKYLSEDIKDTELAELKGHAQQCASCRDRLEQVGKMQSLIRSAFSSATTAKQASNAILSQITPRRTKPAPTALFGRQMAIAASVLIAIGLLLGFYFGRVSAVRQESRAPLAVQVPIQVTDLEGTVLVRHEGSDVWQMLEAGSSIHLGDTFHSTAKSAFVLEMKDKSTIEVNQNSMLVLKLYNGGTQFHLEHGKLAAALNSPHPPFFVSTPHGRVEALGTEFTVTVE